MKRTQELYIGDILESIEKIERYVKGFTEKNFYQDSQLQDAILRRLEIMGEAVKNISQNFRIKYPEIPWKNIAGLRDVLTHEYFGVNLKRVWKIIKEDLPELKEKISKILKQHSLKL